MHQKKIDYRPEIDGLRSIAVIPVILFHMGYDLVSGGFAGVDVFFVISGFLITTIVAKEIESGSFSLKNFWARRIRRIVPAMLLVTSCTLVFTYTFVFRPEQQLIGQQATAAILSVANIYFWVQEGDYWSQGAEESPFLHYWSLAIEEQFYLLLPIAMLVCIRYRKVSLKVCVLVATIASFTLFTWGCYTHPTATFYLLPTRAWELGVGALLAFYSNAELLWFTKRFAAFVGLSMIALSYISLHKLDLGIVLAVAGSALVIRYGQQGFQNKLLRHPVMIHIGKLSYSLYLWHWPILVFRQYLNIDTDNITGAGTLLISIYLAALATHFLVENPCRNPSISLKRILVCSSIVAFACVTIATTRRTYNAEGYAEARFLEYSARPDYKIHLGARWINISRENPGYYPGVLEDGGIKIGSTDRYPEMVVVGDSHAQMWSDSIATISRKNNISTAFLCQLGSEEEWYWNNKKQFDADSSIVFKFLREWKPKLLLIGLQWRNKRHVNVERFLEFAGSLGTEILLIEDPPWLTPCGNRSSIQWHASLNISPEAGKKVYQKITYETANMGGRGWVRELADRYSFAEVIPVHDYYVSEKGILTLDDRKVIHIDDDHLSQHGATIARPVIERYILGILTSIKDKQ